MASIRVFLTELEARLAPALDAQSLQERLTEAEVHLRDRAQEFEEIGLPPLEAEARAVAAFGDPEEYAEDVPVEKTVSPTRKAREELGLGPVVAVLALGAVASLISGKLFGCAAGTLAAFTMLGFAARHGRVVRLRRLLSLGLVVSLAFFGVLCAGFVPTPYGAAQPRFSAEGGLAYGRLKAFDANWQRVKDSREPPRATWDQLTETGIVSSTSLNVVTGHYYVAPGLDASSTAYGIYRDPKEAVAMWDQNGRFVRRLLLLEAMEGGYAEELDPGYRIRTAAFAPQALGFFVAFVSAALLAQTLGRRMGKGAGRFRRAVYRRDAANPSIGTFDRF